MKRLTERNCNSGDYYMKCSKNCYNECAENIDCEDLYELIDRYGAIEEIIGDYSYIDRLRELVEADREGRCVIMPVKEGDIVYCIMHYIFEDNPPEIFEAPFHITDYYNIGKTVFLTEEAAEAALEGELNG